MFDLIQSSVLNWAGMAFELAGTIVLFHDFFTNQGAASRLISLKLYIDTLDLSIDRTAQKTKGQGTDPMMDLLDDGAREAQLKNKQLYLKMLNDADDASHRRTRAVVIAVTCAVVGLAMQLAAALWP